MRKLKLLKKKRCLKCGKEFLLGSAISDYCVTCLQTYPEECHMHLTCFYPKCGHIKVKYRRFSLTGVKPNYYCEKLNFEFPTILPDISDEAEKHKNCPYHTARPKKE
ncbi:MAG: hypothetical protein QW279_03215 [Candidatus Jordarchaeaceae archaeon]